jgi:hypothetical protein
LLDDAPVRAALRHAVSRRFNDNLLKSALAIFVTFRLAGEVRASAASTL